MFVPDHYRAPDGSWLVDLIRGNPLAQLVSNGPGAQGPYATHVPVIIDPNAAVRDLADLTGITLWGHMNRANPHWAALEPNTPVVVTFTGPHAYVSPTIYEMTPAAPTWNFTAVHVRGVLRKVESRESSEETLETVEATVCAFEAKFGAGWAMSDSLGYFRRILPGVGAFRIAVTHADGMFKLSQEQKPNVRRRVECSFAVRESTNHRELAALMGRLATTD